MYFAGLPFAVSNLLLGLLEVVILIDNVRTGRVTQQDVLDIRTACDNYDVTFAPMIPYQEAPGELQARFVLYSRGTHSDAHLVV